MIFMVCNQNTMFGFKRKASNIKVKRLKLISDIHTYIRWAPNNIDIVVKTRFVCF